MDEKDIDIGRRLKVLRQAKGLSGPQLARLAGVPQPSISSWENGKKPMQVKHAEALAQALNVSPMYLLWGDGIEKIDHQVSRNNIPLLGLVHAGVAMMSEEVMDFVEVSGSEFDEECYALKIVGDSMVGEHIVDGDIVIVCPQECAENGDLAIVSVDGCQAIKLFYQRRDHVELRAANPDVPTMIVSSGDVQIKGIVVHVERSRKRRKQ
jgi:repressor LexA